MPIKRPSTESQPRPRKAVDVLQATDTEPVSDLMFDPKIDISPASEKVMFEKLNKVRNNDWWDFSNMAMCLSILYPDRKADLQLGESEFNGMKAELNRYRNNDWLGFSELAINLTLLSAERAQITADGRIKLTYKKKDIAKRARPLPIVSRV